ncbi:MBL fold metallo-hydrolase [Magnetococcales bacterium HHB-1]
MQFTILGSGTGVPNPKRNAPGYHAQTQKQSILIDCGSGSMTQMVRFNIDYQQLDTILITHIHGDHIGGLIELMHALRFFNFTRTKPLTIYGPTDFSAFYDRVIRQTVGDPKMFSLTVKECSASDTLTLDDVTITIAKTVHSDKMHSQAYRLNHQGRSIVFTGDCDFDEGIIKLMTNAQVGIFDCSTLDEDKVKGHLTAGECGKIAALANLDQVILSHLYPIDGPSEQRITQCQKHYPGQIIIAEDGMSQSLK